VTTELGEGIEQDIEVYPGVVLWVGRYRFWDETVFKSPESQHPVQFGFRLAGRHVTSLGGELNQTRTIISGGGIQPAFVDTSADAENVIVDITMSPDRLKLFFPDDAGDLPPELDFLAQENDWQTLIFPKTTAAIQRTVQEIVNCPYQGFEKRLYLQGKVHELIGLQLATVLRDRSRLPTPQPLKPATVATVHYARDLLLTRLEQPPSLSELAQQVGMSDRTLQRNFRKVFGTTVFSYLTQHRMSQAEQLLREGKITVAEVANRLGYAHLGCFAKAFKQQFGITPRECLIGKRSSL
jgi:AraC-like DNA-binding protein